MNYEIIKDKEALLEFIGWLPDLKANEKYYCTLFSRKKYSKNSKLKSDKAQLRRFLTDKERMVNKIKQLEIKKNEYVLFGEQIEEESLALYINPNPRSLIKATYDSIIELTKLLRDEKRSYYPHAEVMSCIQRSVGRKIFLDFDIDYKPFDPRKLDEFINRDCVDILETRGGYHILVRVKEIKQKFKSKFYNGIKSLNVDQTGDQLIPVPGCTQGGFIPKFVKHYEK